MLRKMTYLQSIIALYETLVQLYERIIPCCGISGNILEPV